jgi:carbonic anhydrase
MQYRIYSCFLLIALIAIGFCDSVIAAVDDSAIQTSWGYKGNVGPEFWGRLNPNFRVCGEGKSQSPINILRNDVEVANTLNLHYQLVPMIIMDDGDTTLTIGHQQTIINDGHSVQINFHDNNEFITYEGNKYFLIQFHFHSPSENQLNSESTPLEIHFVHQGMNGQVVVIGVLIKGGGVNPVLAKIIQHLPIPDGKEHMIPSETINPRNLFPIDNDYYSFIGSLTTPPCTQGLQWIVMASTLTASPAQIAILRRAIGGSNMRYVQPLNNRTIAYSLEKK